MKPAFNPVSLGLAVLALSLGATAAKADLRLCNRTSYILYAATARAAGTAVQSQGWTRLAPGDCADVLKASLPPQGVFVYARSSLAHSGPQRAWGGNFPACVRDGDFSLRQPPASCNQADAYAVPFAETGGRPDFTMTFDEQPAYASLSAAQLAGVKRLLKDNGYPIAAINAAPDKATEKALNDFRSRMRFPLSAGNAELFESLEREAQKKIAPAGYTVCNDGRQDLLVATGEETAKGKVSRGWWRIAPKACVRTITTPLSADAVWLLAESLNGAVVKGGPERFCVAPQKFELTGDCAAPGATQAGFARTPTKGLGGAVIHVGQAGTPK